MKNKLPRLALRTLFAISLITSGCAHIEGTRDKSATFQRDPVVAIDSIAILPIQEDSGMPGLAQRVESSLPGAVHTAFPTSQIIDAPTTASLLAQHGMVTTYGQWRSGYEFTKIIDPGPFGAICSAIGAQHLLIVHQPHISREKVKAANLGYTGLVADANNTWRTDLHLPAELINTQSGQIEWSGDGHSEQITSNRDRDLGKLCAGEHAS